MKARNSRRKVAETAVGAALGAAIAGPAGAVVGGLVASQVGSRVERPGEPEKQTAQPAPDADDPIVHAQLRRILVPLDFSPPSHRAVGFAREWAARFGADVLLLHVVEAVNIVSEFDTIPMVVPPPISELTRQATAALEKIAAQETPSSTKVSVHIRHGVAYDQIVIAARELNADLVIIATHGRSGLLHVLLGSTAERVVRHAPCPVLTLRRSSATS